MIYNADRFIDILTQRLSIGGFFYLSIIRLNYKSLDSCYFLEGTIFSISSFKERKHKRLADHTLAEYSRNIFTIVSTGFSSLWTALPLQDNLGNEKHGDVTLSHHHAFFC